MPVVLLSVPQVRTKGETPGTVHKVSLVQQVHAVLCNRPQACHRKLIDQDSLSPRRAERRQY
jgi:hypothetical protein